MWRHEKISDCGLSNAFTCIQLLQERRGAIAICHFFLMIHAMPRGIDLRQTMIAGQGTSIPIEKIPIERVEGTGVLSSLLRDVIPAAIAIVRHS